MTRTRKNVMRVVIAMIMMVVIALGGVMALKYTVWTMAQTYGSYYLEDRGVVAETNYIDNKMMVELHHRNGDKPCATIYDIGAQGYLEEKIMNGRTIDVYDDGAIEVVSL